MKSFLTFFFFFVFTCFSASAQDNALWRDISEAAIPVRGERSVSPASYRTLSLAFRQMRERLAEAPERFVATNQKPVEVDIPFPDGSLVRFEVWAVSLMHPDLAAHYPGIRAFAGRQKENPATLIRLDYGPLGFHAMVLTAEGPDVFIDPWQKGDVEHYISYFVSDFYATIDKAILCTAYDLPENQEYLMSKTPAYKAGDCQLRQYRLALACTGEYANFHGSNTSNNDKSFAIAAMNTTMNRVNGVLERDASITMQLVPNNDVLVFLDPATDPYTNNDGVAMLAENQTTCDNLIGSANYDIGHVFSTGGGGVAYLNAPCNNSIKAGGVTGSSNPVGDPFDIDYVAHEMGHQYGGRHTQNNNCNRDNQSSYEPGSASTIMGYAGICTPNVQNNSDDYYHLNSLILMGNFVTGSGNSCATIINTSNTAPVANAGMDYTIPRSTPFKLTGSATDVNDASSSLTYCWEQYDKEVAVMPPVSTSTVGPMFRSFQPASSASRYFPQLSSVIADASPTWEVLPSVGRTLNFRMTVRDNNSTYGCTDDDAMVVTVDGNSGPFEITSPTSTSSWSPGTAETITWNVAGTASAPINCSNVDIFLSTDGGLTFPITLATATPNDGSHAVTVPNNLTTQAVVLIECSNNIFFDASNSFPITNDVCSVFSSSDVPKTISSSGTPTITSTLAINASGSVTDVNVSTLQLTHTWIGDLTVSLISPDNTTVQLVDQICSSNDDMDISFDDEAASPYSSIPCPPTDGGAYQPQNPLSAFDMKGLNGTWTLQVVDNADQDGGTLDAWSLRICYQATQPVGLVEFTAQAEEFENILFWSSEYERNSAWYVIERSIDGRDFAEIGRVAAAGYATAYGFQDLQPPLFSYYRLRMEDADGSVAYSKVVYVQREEEVFGNLRLSPNPARDEVQLSFASTQAGLMRLSLYDVLGRLQYEEVLAFSDGEQAYSLMLEYLPKGMYLLQLEVGGRLFWKRLLME